MITSHSRNSWKVNNWAVELESQHITFEYIPGIQNTLADTLSRLIEMDENIKLPPEEEGKEFGYFPFEELPPVTTQVIEEMIGCEIGNINIQHTDPVEVNTDIHLPLKDEKLVKLQESDPHTHQLRKQWSNNNLDRNAYTMENNILKWKTCMLGYTSPGRQPPGRHPTSWADTPPCPVYAGIHRPAQCMHGYTHPAQCMLGYTPLPSACWHRHGYCWGRYASYWNAFLLHFVIAWCRKVFSTPQKLRNSKRN